MNLGAFLAGFGPALLDAQDRFAQQRERQQRNAIAQQEAALRMRQFLDEQTLEGGLQGALRGLIGAGPPSANAPAGGNDPAALVRRYESEGLAKRLGLSPYSIGFGGADLSNAPLDEYGFPQWSGKQGPAGMSHAAGAYQFQPDTWRRYAAPLGIRDFSPASQDRVFAAAYAREGFKPWAPYNPALAGAIGSGGGGGGPAPAPADAGGDPEVGRLAQAAGQRIPAEVQGKMSIQGLARAIDEAMPNAPDRLKVQAFERMSKMLSPWMQQQWQEQRAQRERAWQLEDRDFSAGEKRAAETRAEERDIRAEKRTEETRARERAAVASQDWHVYTDSDGTRYRFNPKTGEARTFTGNEPYQPKGGGQPIGSGSAAARVAPHNIEVSDAQGRSVYRGAARIAPDGSFIRPDGTTVEIPEGGALRMTGTGEGRQGAQQINRVVGAANLLSAELGNLMRLPKTSTASIFQGVEAVPGRDLSEALRRTLAAKFTPEEATDLATSFQGVARAVATLEAVGAATGLVGLSEQSRVYQPQPTDTVGNVMRKFATLRQILERGLESASAAKDTTPEQRQLFEKLKAEVAESVPFTVEDVSKLQRGDKETYQQLFQRVTAARQGAAQPSRGPYSVGQIIEKGGKRYRVVGGDPDDPEVEEVR